MCRSRVLAILPTVALACGCVSPGGGSTEPVRLSPEVAAQPVPDPGLGRLAPGAYGKAVLATDDAAAAEVGRRILQSGGNAVDAAVGTLAALAVTLPSRAGFGGGGACLVHEPTGGVSAVDFLPDRGEPRLSAGLRALHDRWGRTAWAELIRPAEAMAERGFRIGEGLARDLGAVEEVLARDPVVVATFGDGGSGLAGEGTQLTQPALGQAIAQLRTGDVTAFAPGGEAAAAFAAPLVERLGRMTVQFGPSEAVYGPELLAVFRFAALDRNYAFTSYDERPHLAIEAQRRAFGGAPEPHPYDPLGASATVEAGDGDTRFGATLAAVDGDGLAIVCGTTLNGLFGRGSLGPSGAFVAAPVDPSAGSLAGLAMVTTEGRLRFAIAAADLPPAIVVTLLERVVAGRAPEASVAMPRVAPDPSTAAILVETAMPPAVVERLAGRGHVIRNAERLGRAAIVDCELRGGGCVAVADPRAAGVAVAAGQAGS